MSDTATPNVEAVKMDLTSMIDVVFLLIIFFILVTEIAKAETEELDLPKATEAVTDAPTKERRVTVNIVRDGSVVVRRHTLSERQLHDALKLEAQLAGRDDQGLSKLKLLIRGDVETEYRTVQKVLTAAAKLQIWKIELGAEAPRSDR
ncbi:MAG: ExbD/TolR family protein [Planctomycetota bacterium]|jgi:biopolymer transport protein ExbD